MDEKRHEGRYDRQTMLPEIGPEGQERLRRARVLIVGAGGLGSPVSLYLAGAGVGRIGLVDDDRVGRSNLHRQVLYAEDEVGQPKALAAARRLRALNPDVEVEPHVCRLSAGNVRLLSDACVALGRPYVYGAVEGFCGQVAVFCRTAGSRTYRDLYPEEDAAARQALASKGVVGMTPAVVGGVQAHEVLKLVCGYGDVLDGRLWTIDLRTMQSYVVEI